VGWLMTCTEPPRGKEWTKAVRQGANGEMQRYTGQTTCAIEVRLKQSNNSTFTWDNMTSQQWHAHIQQGASNPSLIPKDPYHQSLRVPSQYEQGRWLCHRNLSLNLYRNTENSP
jgi:hypothetical protein